MELTKREMRSCARCKEMAVMSIAAVRPTSLKMASSQTTVLSSRSLETAKITNRSNGQAVEISRDAQVEIRQKIQRSSVLKAGELLLGVVEFLWADLPCRLYSGLLATVLRAEAIRRAFAR